MKLFNSVLCYLLVLSSLHTQYDGTMHVQSYDPDDITDFEYKVNGPVRSILETSYIVDANQIIIEKDWAYSWASDSKAYFDRDAHILKKDYYKKDGSVDRSNLYEYREGRLVMRQLDYSISIFIYNDAGLLLEEYQEVSKPRVIATAEVQPIPELYETKLEYEYHTNENIASITEIAFDGPIESKSVYHYTDGSTELDKIVYHYDDVIETYDYTIIDGRITQIKRSDNEEGLFESYDYAYRGGQLVQETWKLYDGGAYDGQVRYRFENYNVVEDQESDYDGTIDFTTTYTYDFDDRGNWIRKYYTMKDKNYMVKREIIYWE